MNGHIPRRTLETPPDYVICLYLKQLWENPTCEGRLICPEEHVSSLNKCNPIQSKSLILSRGPPTACHHCGQRLTIEHMLLECAVLQECCAEYYTVDSLNALFETVPETCIVEFLREAGFFYLIWCNLLTSTSPKTWTIWSDFSDLFRELKQLWDTFTCVGRLICPEGLVSSLNKSNPSIRPPLAPHPTPPPRPPKTGREAPAPRRSVTVGASKKHPVSPY